MLNWIRKILKPPVPVNQEEALIALLQHTMLLIFAAASFIVPILLNLIALLDTDDASQFEFTTLIIGLVVPLIAIGLIELMHRGHIRIASIVITAILFLLTTLTVISFRGIRDSATSMYVLIIVMGGLLLGGRAALVYMILSLLVTFGIYSAEANGRLVITLSETPAMIEWIILAVVLFLIGILLSFARETLTNAIRRARIANEELEGIQQSLEDRVAARTRDLELAAEIGRHLSQKQESEEILFEAVEMIQSRFNLYYTQIYLVDKVRNNLVLRAGTGLVGRQLRQLGHRLPISGSSINGTAVLNKKPVIVADTTSSLIFRQNPLLPDTRSEMAVPLIVSGDVVGVLNLQSPTPDALTEENLPAFEALAGQLAISLENARLFSETIEAQGTVQSLAQSLTRTSWDSYFNAIDREENIAYTFDLTRSSFVDAPAGSSETGSFSVPITLGGANLGQIEIRGNEWDLWDERDQEFAAAISDRMVQQIENLRLLSETERYRSEAEEASRRLIREGWQDFTEDQKEAAGYLYDQQQVVPVASNGSSPLNGTSLVKPLTVRGEAVGQFEIAGAPEDDETTALVEAVAERLSAHIENLRLVKQTETALRSTEQRAEELAVVNRIARTISQALDLEDILNTILEEISRIMQVDVFIVGLYDEEADLLNYPLIYDDGERYQVDSDKPLPESTVYQVLKGHEPQLILRTEEEVAQKTKAAPPTMLGDETKVSASLMYVPLFLGKRSTGIVSVQSYQHDAFSPEDLTLLGGVSNHVAVALENARLFEETERRAEELSVVNQVALVVSQMLELNKLYSAVHEQIQRAIVSDAFFIAIYNEEDNTINFPYLFDDGDHYNLDPVEANPALEVVQVIESGEPIVVNFSTQESAVLDAPVDALLATEKAPTAMLFVPLRSGLKPVGAISVQTYKTHTYTQSDVDLLTGVAYHLAIALENARLFSVTEKRAEELAVINQIAQAVSGHTEQTELLRTVYEQVQRVMPVDAFSVTSYEAATQMIHFLLVIDEGQEFEEPATPLGEGAVSRVIRTGKPILFTRTQEDLDELARNKGGVLIGNVQRFSASMIYVPLQIGTETIGSLSVQSYELNAYTQAEVDLLVGVANHVAVALENARLFEETQNTLAETELLYNIGTYINQAATYEDLAGVVGIPGLANGANSAGLFRFELGEDGQAQYMEMAANWVGEGEESVLPIGSRLNLREISLGTAGLYTPNEPFLIGDIASDERVDKEARILLRGLNTRAIAIVPMQQQDTWIGTLVIRWKEKYTFGSKEQRLYNSLARQMSTALSNQLLLEETQERATQLEKINQVEMALSQAQDEGEILDALSLFFNEELAASIHYLVEEDEPTTAFTVAHWEHGRIQNKDEFLNTPFQLDSHAGFKLGLNQSNRVTFIQDVLDSEDVSKTAAKEAKKLGFRSVLIIPLRSAGRWQGFVSIKWVKPYEISKSEIDIWERLRESLAANITSRRAYLAQQDALSETAVLYQTGAQLSVATSYDEVLDVIRNNTVLGKNVSTVSIMLFDQEWLPNRMPRYADVLTFWSEDVPDQAKLRFFYDDYPSSANLLADPTRVRIFPDVAKSDELDEKLKAMLIRGFNTHTYVLLPMVVRGNWIGYVNAMYPELTTFSEEDVRRTEAIIQQAGVAIEGLRSLKQAEQQALLARTRSNELIILNEMGRSLTALVDMDTILDNVYRYTARLMDATNFYISFYDAKRNEIVFALDVSGQSVSRNVRTRKVGNGLTEYIIRTKEPLLIPENMPAKLAELDIELIGATAASWLGVPLMVGSQVIGVVALQNYDLPNTYNEQHLRLLTSVAAQAVIAIENARLFEQIQARARRERILREVTAKIRSGSDVDTVMKTAVSEIGRALGRRTFVYLNENDPQEPRANKEDAYGD